MGSYLSWLANGTGTWWNNDSANMPQIDNALAQGAIGATTNPPLSYEAIVNDPAYYGPLVAAIDKNLSDDEFAAAAMSLVVKRVAERLAELHDTRGGFYGCVRAQVAPNLRADADGMLAAGKTFAALGNNVMVKIPGTKAGMYVLEELAAIGIPTNPTVIATVSQAIAAAEAFERGRTRALAAGIAPAWSTCAIVMGRAQDYFTALNRERGLGLSVRDLEWAALAIMKRSWDQFKARGCRTVLMPAAFRSPLHVEQLAGGPFCMTIHPSIQTAVEAADRAGEIKREIFFEAPVDADAINRVAAAMPEFTQAIEPDGLAPDGFDTYGAVVMTLDTFDRDGWQKLASLKRG